MAGARELKVVISGDSKSLNKAFKNSADSASKFGSGLKKVGLIAGAVAVGGIAAVGVGLKKSIDAAKEAEVSQKKLQTQLKALDISYAQHGDTIDKTLQKQSALSAFDDEDLADSFTNLVRLTGDVNKALDLNALAADIARAKGIDLASATSIVTKAQMGNIGALKRQGIEIDKVTKHQDALGKGATDAQKAQAKALDLQATKQQAVGLLTEKFAGQAKAYGETAAGAQERLGVAFENLGEIIGGKVLPHLTPLVEGLTNFINRAAESERLGSILTTVGDVITTATGIIKTAFQTLAEQAEIYWPRVQAAAAKVMTWYQTNLEPTITSVLENISQAHKDAGDDSVKNTTQTFGKIPPIQKAIMGSMLNIINAGLAVLRGDWDTAWKNISQIPGKLLKSGIDQLRYLNNIIESVLAGIALAGMQAFHATLGKAWGKIKAFFSSWPNRITGAIGDLGSVLYNAGLQVLGGFLDGLRDKWEDVKSFLSGLNPAKYKGPPERDKQLLYQAGVLVMGGFQSGMDFGWEKLKTFLSRLSPELASKAGAAVDAAIAAVNARKDALGAAFDGLASLALEAFDKITGGFKTASERALEAFDLKQARIEAEKQLQALRDAVTKAEDAIRTAQAEGPEQVTQKAGEDPAAFAERQLAAQEAYNDKLKGLTETRNAAQTALDDELEARRVAKERADLAARAERERKNYEDRRGLQRRHFEEKLADLRADLANDKITRKKFNKELLELYERFEIPLRQRGKKLGLALTEGLSEAQVEVANAADALLNAVKRQLEKVEFVINVLIRDAGKKKPAEKRALGGPVRRGQPYLVGERGPELFIPGQTGKISPNAAGGSGGGGTYVFNFPNYVGDRRDLERQMQQVMRRFEDSNGISFTGRAL